MTTIARPSPRSSALSAHTGSTQAPVSAAIRPTVAASSGKSMTPIPAYPAITEARSKASAERIRNGPDHHDHFPRDETPAGTLWIFAGRLRLCPVHRVERTLAG